ncbi:low molecular weight phosphotyrosine protein phosphatase [Photobacterium sp. SDRW27]|uniref:low molecular weight protein-tyrosine-phosphatase n=1 Tax=Photobacterium obscurum TaxID=2829490 RepID=UPI0022444609|nr:low molecular weight protein-tyrosine-phosphatase [Photobacterium obscurum]MCW8330823.1 low molecular weight phosphotyrosine protein phosphatase [Photobacterium obscurum]
MSSHTNRVLVVCMGNICRSPTAEAVLRSKARIRGVELDIDSAGTIGYHQGEQPDSRAQTAGEARGYSFSGIRARQVEADDFERFDLILAADEANLRDLKAICPVQHQPKLALYLSYSNSGITEIPDPYYGGPREFEEVLDLIEDATERLLDTF